MIRYVCILQKKKVTFKKKIFLHYEIQKLGNGQMKRKKKYIKTFVKRYKVKCFVFIFREQMRKTLRYVMQSN